MWYKIKARTGGGEVCGIRLRPGLGVGKSARRSQMQYTSSPGNYCYFKSDDFLTLSIMEKKCRLIYSRKTNQY